MTEDCIFCDIVRGKAPASVVHVDELTMAFVDLRQHSDRFLCVADTVPDA